jgi:hypothetical protein
VSFTAGRLPRRFRGIAHFPAGQPLTSAPFVPCPAQAARSGAFKGAAGGAGGGQGPTAAGGGGGATAFQGEGRPQAPPRPKGLRSSGADHWGGREGEDGDDHDDNGL